MAREIKSWYVETGAMENVDLGRTVRFPSQRDAEEALSTLDDTRDRNGREATIEESTEAPNTSLSTWMAGDAGERWYKFGGANLQACYGWGTDAEALAYVAYLNRNRGTNLYGMEPLSDSSETATAMCPGLVSIADDGVNLADALADIDD